MGIGANVLGYANKEVDEAAKEAIEKGGMSTLNAPEEVYLAQELIKLHPWAGGVRYAKAGGEAMALASRIARPLSLPNLYPTHFFITPPFQLPNIPFAVSF